MHAQRNRLPQARAFEPTKFLSQCVYARLARLTRIPQDRLVPAFHPIDNMHWNVFYEAHYSSTAHLIEVKRVCADSTVEHELKHGLQYLSQPHLISQHKRFSRGWFRHVAFSVTNFLWEFVSLMPRELYASYNAMDCSAQLTAVKNRVRSALASSAFAFSLASLAAVSNAFFPIFLAGAFFPLLMRDLHEYYAAKSLLNLQKTMEKYGPDGFLALNLLGCPRPFIALEVLDKLARQGLLCEKGFTKSGKEWVRSFKPKILEFLELSRRNLAGMLEKAQQ